jgi:hypothetical protein
MTMLSRFFEGVRDYFTTNLGVESTPDYVPVEYHLVEQDPLGSIRQMKNGKYRLLVNENEVVATYSRYRDAVRGANRRGICVL